MHVDEMPNGRLCLVLDTDLDVATIHDILSEYNLSVDGTLREPIDQDVINQLYEEFFK